MKLTAFRVTMYKCFLDSTEIRVEPLTVLVGKNESGKTSILKALHKFNPFHPEPYDIRSEWPRGRRDARTGDQVVCAATFELTPEERSGLSEIVGQEVAFATVTVTKDYNGKFEVLFPDDVVPDKLHPNDIDAVCESLPGPPAEIGDAFRQEAVQQRENARRLAREGRFSELQVLEASARQQLQTAYTPGNPQPQHEHEEAFINTFCKTLAEIRKKLQEQPTIRHKAHDYAVSHLPTFVYMDEYRVFQGHMFLDQLKKRRDSNKATPDDGTFLTLLALAGLDLDDECRKMQEATREERQFDLSDASQTLTGRLSPQWSSISYEVQFRADAAEFFTFVKSPQDKSLISLQERSRGFQWFFSFDAMLMHQTKGTLKECVILLDEPGLHLHPNAQRDLLKRLEEYARGNVLVYSTHLPFMIDLQQPERIRVLGGTDGAWHVTEDLTKTHPDAKLTLQAALGMSGRVGMPVGNRNLVVEGVHDYWYLTALSNLLVRSGKVGLHEDVVITAAAGASEVTYMATFMVGQSLDVVALYDADTAGREAHDKFVKNWLARYKNRNAQALLLNKAIGSGTGDLAIEDLFPEAYYWEQVKAVYGQQVATGDLASLELRPGATLAGRAETSLGKVGVTFNKGSVAKRICAQLRKMKSLDELPAGTADNYERLIGAINEAFENMSPLP